MVELLRGLGRTGQKLIGGVTTILWYPMEGDHAAIPDTRDVTEKERRTTETAAVRLTKGVIL